MTIPLAYRNQLLAQFVESFVTFVHNKRKVAELLAKGELTPEEAVVLQHCQTAVARSRAVFAIWKAGLQDHTKFNDPTTGLPFPAGSYTLAQIKTFILANRAAISDVLTARYDAEIAEVEALKTQVEAAAVTEEEIANLPNLLTELDTRKTKREYWRSLVVELKNKSDDDYATEGEI